MFRTDQSEYQAWVESAGMRVVIHNSDEYEFLTSFGYYASVGLSTNIAVKMVTKIASWIVEVKSFQSIRADYSNSPAKPLWWRWLCERTRIEIILFNGKIYRRSEPAMPAEHSTL